MRDYILQLEQAFPLDYEVYARDVPRLRELRDRDAAVQLGRSVIGIADRCEKTDAKQNLILVRWEVAVLKPTVLEKMLDDRWREGVNYGARRP